MLLIAFSSGGRNAGAGVVVKVLDPGMQAQKFLGPFPPLESKLLPLLTPCGPVGLLDDIVAAGRRDHLLMVNAIQAGQVANGGLVAPQLIRMDHLWDIIFTQQPRQKGFRCFGVSVPLKQNVEHEAVLVHTPPQPVSDAIHRRADFVQIPPGTPPGFPVAQFFSEQRAKVHAPLAQRFVADLDAALVEQFLHVTVTEGEAVIQPNSVLDNRHRKAVAVGLEVSHSGSAYPDPVKATQPAGPRGMMAFQRLDPLQTLFSTQALQALADQVRGRLQSEDPDGKLDDTLRQYLEHRGSLAELAHHLHLHVNTLRYRLRRIEEVLGGELSEPAFVARLYLAFHAVRTAPGD